MTNVLVLQAFFFFFILTEEFINPKKCPLVLEDLNEGAFDSGVPSLLRGASFI